MVGSSGLVTQQGFARTGSEIEKVDRIMEGIQNGENDKLTGKENLK